MIFTQFSQKTLVAVVVNIIIILLQERPVASFLYDCEENAEFGGTKQDLFQKKGGEKVLPCVFKDMEIPANYNKKVPPKFPNMKFNVSIENVKFIEDTGECNVTIFMIYYWIDERLSIVRRNDSNETTIWLNPPSLLNYFWNPTPKIEYSSTTQSYGMVDGEFEKPKEKGSVVLEPYNSAKHNITKAVKFGAFVLQHFLIPSENSYIHYPYDKHEFLVNVRSGFDVEGDSSRIFFRKLAIWHPSFKIGINGSGSRKEMEDFDFGDEEHDKYLGLVILLTRKLNIHVIRTYIPSGLFVILCWLSMFVPVELATERVALCTATLLTITMFFNTISETGPDASYMRAVDTWLLAATTFVFLVLFENLVVLKLTGRFTKDKLKLEKISENIHQLQLEAMENRSNLSEISSGGADEGGKKIVRPTHLPGGGGAVEVGDMNQIEEDINQLRARKLVAAKIVDRIGIFLITAAILTFNGMYWTWLLIAVQTDCQRDFSCPPVD